MQTTASIAVVDSKAAAKSSFPSTTTSSSFPVLLHRMLTMIDEQSRNGDVIGKQMQDIISWLPSGDAFQIHDRKRFIEEVMPV